MTTCVLSDAFGEDETLRAFEPHIVLLDVGMSGVGEQGIRERVATSRVAREAVQEVLCEVLFFIWSLTPRELADSEEQLVSLRIGREGAEEEAVPMWKAIGVPEARASSAAGAFLLEELEDAVAEGDFEKAIELRGQVRLTMGRSNSVHQMNAEL